MTAAEAAMVFISISTGGPSPFLLAEFRPLLARTLAGNTRRAHKRRRGTSKRERERESARARERKSERVKRDRERGREITS
jgi:siroheme synthase (precorrin-2 oxidase/ferrochelatase)